MEKKKKITLFSFIIAFIMLVSTGIVLLTNDNNNKIVKAVYNNQFNATWQFFQFNYTIGYGDCVWTDGTNYYYDRSGDHFIYDSSTNSWSILTWTNAPATWNGAQVWTDGTNYYYSQNGGNSYTIDTTNHTFTLITWNNSITIRGDYVWSDGTDIYYDNGSIHYIFDKVNLEWNTNTWTGVGNFAGQSVWTDGTNYYIANGVSLNQYILNIPTKTATQYSLNGLTHLYGQDIVYLDNYIFYIRDGDSYILDTSNNSWSSFTFNFDNGIAVEDFDGHNVFLLGNNIYYASYFRSSSYYNMRLILSNQNNGGNVTPDAFTGSNVYIPFTPGIVTATGAINGPQLQYSGSTNLIYYLDLQMSFGINQNNDYYITFTSNYLNNQSFVDITHMLDNSYSSLSDFTFTSNDIGGSIRFYLYDNNTYTDLGVNSPLGPNGRVVSVTVTISQDFTDFSFIGCHMFSDYTQDNNMYSINNHVRYFDANNGYIDISIYSYTSIGSAVDMYSSRMYYFESALSNGSSYGDYISGYNQGYDEGYSDGESDGYSTGSTSGYNNGYQAGYTAASGEVGQTQYQSGYQAGYTDGANDANTYSFTALIGSVIDTPIRYFSSLFNFNLLGVNLLTFMLALLTLGFVIIIIKHII